MNCPLNCLLGIALLFGAPPFSAIARERPAPPKIMRTEPDLWSVDVRPSMKKLLLTFDQPMRPGFTAWLGRRSVLPEIQLSDAISGDRKTFEIGVELQPGKVYVFGLNEKAIPGVGFQTAAGISMPPHYLVFQTAGSAASEDRPPAVARTFPAADAIDVAPNSAPGIIIEFSMPMMTDSHGAMLTEGGKPVDLKNAKFSYDPEGTTFTLQHPLKSNATYHVELNSNRNIGFRSSNRIPLWPARFRFSTGEPSPGSSAESDAPQTLRPRISNPHSIRIPPDLSKLKHQTVP